MRSCRLASLALAAAAGCATAPEPAAPPAGPPPFQGARSLVLARWTDDPAGRPKDPLDALKESLDARGLATRMVDVGGRTPPELRDLERLHATVGSRIHGGQRDRFSRRVEPLGRDAGQVVAALGVDVVALYHRFDGRPPPAAFPEPSTMPGAPFPPSPALERSPLGAFSLVDRAGEATWVDWGAADAEFDPEVPANAAEAIDAIVAVLTGETREE